MLNRIFETGNRKLVDIMGILTKEGIKYELYSKKFPNGNRIKYVDAEMDFVEQDRIEKKYNINLDLFEV